jgi:prophage DNA circulation protein
MAWLDNFRQAKFRTAEFYVPSAENRGGRRGVVHEFPKRDEPYVEDMGKKAKSFEIEAYVLGEDYFTARNALVEALDAPGVGKLVHPYLGTLDVFCTNYSFRETVTETRMARFTLSFVQAGRLKFPSTTIDTTADVSLKKATALDKVKSALAKVYNIASVPYSVSQNVISTIDQGLSVIDDAKKSVAAFSAFRRDIDNIRGKITQLAFDITDLAQEFTDVITFGTNETDEFSASADNAREQFREMRTMFSFSPNDIIISNDPSVMFAEFIQQNALINALGLMSIINFDSLEEASEFRKIVFDKVEQVLLNLKDDELYIALIDLQTAVSTDLDVRARELPRLAELMLNASLPAIMVSHDIYGNIREEQDILKRNKVAHPLFVQGGVPIEVKIYA